MQYVNAVVSSFALNVAFVVITLGFTHKEKFIIFVRTQIFKKFFLAGLTLILIIVLHPLRVFLRERKNF